MSNRVGPLVLKSTPILESNADDVCDRGSLPERWTGFLYLLATIGLSVSYLAMLNLFMVNDLFWSRFNSTGAQTFVIDAFNLPANAQFGNGSMAFNILGI